MALVALQACSAEGISDIFDGMSKDSYEMADSPAAVGDGGLSDPSGNGGGAQGEAGRLTAGEWKDLDHWDFWGKLMNSQDQQIGGMSQYWGFYTNNRVAVHVKDAKGNPAVGVKVALMRDGKAIWNAVTDNAGRADLFAGLFQNETEDAAGLSLTVGGVALKGTPALTGWNTEQGVSMNEFVSLVSVPEVASVADIAFIVDATGSMGDEISFLKEDLLDILNKAQTSQAAVKYRTAALFYRDEGDRYLTLSSNFSEDFSVTTGFIREQSADGGGDYPEAVHTALEKGLQDLSWSESARARLAFLVLDAPAHYRTDVIASLQKSIETYARLGIRIIPVAASGVDKNTEFMCRFFAVSTGGTYVFLTNHSGIGNEHIEATVGDYKVELLNDLIFRLIYEYTR